MIAECLVQAAVIISAIELLHSNITNSPGEINRAMNLETSVIRLQLHDAVHTKYSKMPMHVNDVC